MAMKAYCLYTVPVVECPVIQGKIGKEEKPPQLLEMITLGIWALQALVSLAVMWRCLEAFECCEQSHCPRQEQCSASQPAGTQVQCCAGVAVLLLMSGLV